MRASQLAGVNEENGLRLEAKLVETLRKVSQAEPEILAKFVLSVLEDVERKQDACDEGRVRREIKDSLSEFNSQEDLLDDFADGLIGELKRAGWKRLASDGGGEDEPLRVRRERRSFRSRSPNGRGESDEGRGRTSQPGRKSLGDFSTE